MNLFAQYSARPVAALVRKSVEERKLGLRPAPRQVESAGRTYALRGEGDLGDTRMGEAKRTDGALPQTDDKPHPKSARESTA